MTQSKVKFKTFEDYLADSDKIVVEGYSELIDGELVELPPESEPNSWIAENLKFLLTIAQVVSRRLIKTHNCEIQVPVLQPKDAANRYPDLVVLRPEHLELTQRRLTVTLDMPPPRLIVEVVSPGKTNRDRDVIDKRLQYAAIAIPEYWLIDPAMKTVMVLSLAGEAYSEIGVFRQQDAIASVEFTGLGLMVEQIFATES
jgi:Uma2 family endonuclease